ncbi:MAG: hemerythrin domain-containing protein [Candidatus Omnitrophica bacterium]|nr:hemerythrin domain-containing protein [Candidatus Omnitrophota bacterium]MCA9437402.1 hemerythrin domain-containing protein [Candidatus Omnitrophota bacterium]MCA9444654.1 hemerythrin domain-containing protein [Candidatus Omnitrophota bacterium]
MKPTEVLMNEHRIIEQVLNCLEKIAEEAKANGRVHRDHAEQAIEFFRNFADQCHHGKEEDRLFPLANERGIPQEGGPIGQMLLEHTIGREAIRKMDEALPAASDGDPAGLALYLEGAGEYLQLLRAHIQKEDRVLFPMADQVLSTQDQENLMASFEQAEKELHDPETHEKSLEIANRLAEHYGVPKATVSE